MYTKVKIVLREDENHMEYTFFQLAHDVLEYADKPLSIAEIWAQAEELGLTDKLSSYGKTPINTLSARMYMDVKKGKDANFIKVSDKPSKFILNKGENVFETLDEEVVEPEVKKAKFRERDLHILLSSYVKANEHFGCLTKTIYHENSKRKKSGINKWLHPDIVGVHFPFESYTGNTLKLFDVLKVNPYKLYSFEMKTELSLSNLRECYFQAVSNSSWAHEGYLVALHIKDESALLDELRRLNNAFGIGVIHLNPQHFMQSEILFSAREQESLDWDTVNRLVAENVDFEKFLDNFMEDITVGKVKSSYDKIYTDEDTAWEKCKELGILP